MTNVKELFRKYQKIPKGVLIQNPSDIIDTSWKFSKSIISLIGLKNPRIFFTKRTLKHLAEKEALGRKLFELVFIILKSPSTIYKGNIPERYLFSKSLPAQTRNKAHTVTIEINKNDENLIISVFIGKEKYLKNFDLLWGAAVSPSQASSTRKNKRRWQ